MNHLHDSLQLSDCVVHCCSAGVYSYVCQQLYRVVCMRIGGTFVGPKVGVLRGNWGELVGSANGGIEGVEGVVGSLGAIDRGVGLALATV